MYQVTTGSPANVVGLTAYLHQPGERTIDLTAFDGGHDEADAVFRPIFQAAARKQPMVLRVRRGTIPHRRCERYMLDHCGVKVEVEG